MRPTVLLLVAAVAACGGGRIAAPPPGRPIVAPEEPTVRPDACNALVTSLERYHACVPDDRKGLIGAWLERAKIDFAALSATDVSDDARQDTARACTRADAALQAALAACPGA